MACHERPLLPTIAALAMRLSSTPVIAKAIRLSGGRREECSAHQSIWTPSPGFRLVLAAIAVCVLTTVRAGGALQHRHREGLLRADRIERQARALGPLPRAARRSLAYARLAASDRHHAPRDAGLAARSRPCAGLGWLDRIQRPQPCLRWRAAGRRLPDSTHGRWGCGRRTGAPDRRDLARPADPTCRCCIRGRALNLHPLGPALASAPRRSACTGWAPAPPRPWASPAAPCRPRPGSTAPAGTARPGGTSRS